MIIDVGGDILYLDIGYDSPPRLESPWPVRASERIKRDPHPARTSSSNIMVTSASGGESYPGHWQHLQISTSIRGQTEVMGLRILWKVCLESHSSLVTKD